MIAESGAGRRLTGRPPIERMMLLAELLRMRKPINTRTAAEKLEVDRKTIQRDLAFMRDGADEQRGEKPRCN